MQKNKGYAGKPASFVEYYQVAQSVYIIQRKVIRIKQFVSMH